MAALIVVLAVLLGAGLAALYGLFELRRKRVEELAERIAARTAEEYSKRLKP